MTDEERAATTTPFGLTGREVNYIIYKFELTNLDYINGILYVPNEFAEQITVMMSDTRAFRNTVKEWENTDKSTITPEEAAESPEIPASE